ncbi:class II glutamine amidotransferase [Spirillospora sp. CA-294931]|uniref:class II glutamine amidotransferase n=1 Tax=Spirillospora sp. CA-294931 TaxID=3240042 RepID=UPI003D919A8B
MICISSSMCGLFGLLRSPVADRPDAASDALVALGMLAEERGRDSAGLALVSGAPSGPGYQDDRRSDLNHDGCRVIKGRGPFSGIWRSDLLAALDAAPVVLGHTRWATQGTPYDLANASPMLVTAPGTGVIATHNGDVEAGALRAAFALPPALGTTDSEPIFQLLAGTRTPDDVTGVLTTLVGRAALAWVDRARPGRVHLARAALSPLAVALDTDRNLYWASNPRWFREVGRHTGVTFATVVMLREGTYLRLDAGPRVAKATFRPTARAIDLDPRVWTGFTESDMRLDREGLLHDIAAPAPVPGPNTGGYATLS